MLADRPSEDHALRGLRVGVGLGAVALLAGLGLRLVEIRVAEVAEEPRRRRLGDPGERRQLGGAVGVDQRLILEQKRGQFLLSLGEAGRSSPEF